MSKRADALLRSLLPALMLLIVGGCASPGEHSTDDASRTLTILTYNVLASNDRDDQRLPALFTILEESGADFLCLQEVLPSFVGQLSARPWFRTRYHLPRHRGRTLIANGNIICSRHPIDRAEVIDHRSPQGRKSLVVHVEVDGRPLAVATCHLESLLEDGPIRAKQLGDVFAHLTASDDVIFAGDFNFGEGEQPETARLDPGYLDLWSRLRPGEPGFTWDIDENDMAARGSFVREGSRRLDRILLRSGRWEPRGVRVIGNKEIDDDGLLFPSDHYGVVGVIGPKR